ncbi:hypothetical protein E4T56_gene4007 [Termitomyces sp. T112]|nr:hypothetical protein E4T56_gene4007 [Termitomyces sp. T112]
MQRKLAPEKPRHPFGVKRVSLEQWYYEVFNQPNVDLIDINENPIVEITPKGVKTQDGMVHELDVLVLATGFDAVTGSIAQIGIQGVDGVAIGNMWKQRGLSTYLGMTVTGFPNMFFPYGPHGPTAFCNGPTCAEVQGNWIIECLTYLREHNYSRIDATREASEAWVQRVNDIFNKGLWLQAKSWYTGANVPGKRLESLNFSGGLPLYTNLIQESARDFNPPKPKVETEFLCPTLTPPLTFYDKHLDKRLSLKKVASTSSLLSDLSKTVDNALDSVIADDIGLPSVEEGFPNSKMFTIFLDPAPAGDAKAIGRWYQVSVSLFATKLASMLSLHPTASSWSTAIDFTARSLSRSHKCHSLFESYIPRFLDTYKPEDSKAASMIDLDAWNAMSDAERTLIRQARERFPFLAVWQFFFACDKAENALKDVDNLVALGTFPQKIPLTMLSDYAPNDIELSSYPDAITTAWGPTLSSWLERSWTSERAHFLPTSRPVRRSARYIKNSNTQLPASRSKSRTSKPGGHTKTSILPAPKELDRSWPQVTLPVKQKQDIDDDQVIISMLQHAWTRAVERDSSFIVLHCGTFERIAFRHRSTQTLFVSDLIDVTQCKDPGYSHIHIGLFMSIVEDVCDRTRQLVSKEVEKKFMKRKRNPLPFETVKRPRTRASVVLEKAQKLDYQKNFNALCENLIDCDLMLLHIQHGPYNSPVPSAFLRVIEPEAPSRSIFGPQEYFRITITSELAYGATGDTHAATIDLLRSDGHTISFTKAVVKLAFNDAQKKRLRHEFRIYNHLMSAGARGIPYVFGLFQDFEGEALALVMEHVGQSLWECRVPDKTMRLVTTISESEKEGLLDALKSIHNAGVRHRDLRLENLTINHEGNPFIIDFDRAHLQADLSSREREYEDFMALLSGLYETNLSYETQESDTGVHDYY